MPSTISTTVTTTVLLGSPTFPSPLTITITGTGAVTPSLYGAPAVLATAPGLRLLNASKLDNRPDAKHPGSVGRIALARLRERVPRPSQ